MRIVSVGDLVVDYYYKDGKLLGINGGMTSHNIIANLAKKGIKTAAFACCGDDFQGQIAIKSLEKLKVDISNIKIIKGIKTRCFHISYHDENGKLSFTSKKRCPFCNTKKWYDESLLDTKYILSNIKPDDILVFDNLNEKNQVIIDNADNKKVIDLGQYFELEKMSNEEIIKKIDNKFEIINFNERVSNYLLKRLNLENELDLYNIIHPQLMTITRGENGATFIANDNIYNFKLISRCDVVDSTGAGDAFISSVIKECIKNNFVYSANKFKKWYENSNKLTAKVVSKMGARGHINSLFKIKKINQICTCDMFDYKERKAIKRCNVNINNLEKRLMNALNSPVCDNLDTVGFSKETNSLFIGTGGSYAGAYFSAKVINILYGCNTYALYPRDVLYRNNTNINKIFLFSYSGTTNDIINSVKNLNKENVYIITKGELQNIALKTEISKKNIFSYRTSSNKGKEKGFLSFEGAVAPAAIFLKYYLDKSNNSINIYSFITDSMKYWTNRIEKIINKNIIEKLKKYKLINIFRGDYTDTACFDLESKIIESGIFNCIIHEKKNFSHGRFVNYENLENNFSIYFKQKLTTNYELELLKYLNNNCVVIESKYNGILAEFDLLIASQFIIYYIGRILDIDVSKPKYSENAMKIYFYNGDL